MLLSRELYGFSEYCQIYVLNYSCGNTEYEAEYTSPEGRQFRYKEGSLEDVRALCAEWDVVHKEVSDV